MVVGNFGYTKECEISPLVIFKGLYETFAKKISSHSLTKSYLSIINFRF